MADTISDTEALAYALQRGPHDLENRANAVYWIGPNGKFDPRRLPNERLIADIQRVIIHLQRIQSVLQAEIDDPAANVAALLDRK